MTNYESLEVACVIKEKEVVCKYKGKRSEAKGQAGEVPEERNVTEEAGLEESWARSGSKSPAGIWGCWRASREPPAASS